MITALQNNKIKNIVKLASKAKERSLQQLFIIEGAREITIALDGGYEIDSIYFCWELYQQSYYKDLLSKIPDNICFEVDKEVFQKIAYREGSDGLLALAKAKAHTLGQLSLPSNPFLILIESVEKPGNLGAILRTADAARVDAVIVCDPLTDIYNPNTIRSSIGCVFTVPLATCTKEEAFEFFKSNNIQSYAAELTASQWYHDTDFRGASAILMGTEADGLSEFCLQNASARIKIPMRGCIDSLNVSVSAAIITFEAMRQRGF